MKNYTVFIALLLGACATMTEQEFFQDQQNSEKFNELERNALITGCDKVVELNKFVQLEKPTNNDLASIMPILGLKTTYATDVNKMYDVDLSVIKKYSCTDIRDEKVRYCLEKYGDTLDLFKENQCLASLYNKIPPFSTYDKYSDDINYVYEGKDLIEKIKDKISQIYTMPEDVNYLLSEFKPSELIKANNEILGKYDGDCYGHYGYLCDYDTNIVTRLHAVQILNNFCKKEHFWIWGDEKKECTCFAHETYQKVNYKNVIYIHEKKELPQSKKTEFNQIYEKCEQKIENQRIKAEKERYGEAKSANSDENNVFIEALENAAWAHRTITETRKKAENK